MCDRAAIVGRDLVAPPSSIATSPPRPTMATFGIDPASVARAIAFAIEQPDDVEIGDITIRPTVQN